MFSNFVINIILIWKKFTTFISRRSLQNDDNFHVCSMKYIVQIALAVASTVTALSWIVFTITWHALQDVKLWRFSVIPNVLRVLLKVVILDGEYTGIFKSLIKSKCKPPENVVEHYKSNSYIDILYSY